MLARAPPGSQGDVGPSWLVDDATQYTKIEYQRDMWMGGRGRARARGRGADGGAAQQTGGGGGQDRGGGRGRGRK